MSKIGIVLSGGMNKGAYEIGCLRAIEERFGRESIQCISSSSIGVLTGYSYAAGKLDEFERAWRELDVEQSGKMIIKMSRNEKLLGQIGRLVDKEDRFSCDMYATLWNYSDRQAEFINLAKQETALRKSYLLGAIALPVFNKGIVIRNRVYYDGAFLDNIPVFPLVDKDLDYIFCIYFEDKNYTFENEAFDRKVIRLNRFHDEGRMDFILYDPAKLEEMIEYGYSYTQKILDILFVTEDREEVYERIALQKEFAKSEKILRITADVLMNNLNKVTSRLTKRKMI